MRKQEKANSGWIIDFLLITLLVAQLKRGFSNLVASKYSKYLVEDDIFYSQASGFV